MHPAPRGLEPIEKLCQQHQAHLGVRLFAEYQPGAEAPFPDTPEDKLWASRRESLVVSVLRSDREGIVMTSWTRGGEERREERRLPRPELEAWLADLEGRGSWSPGSLPRIDLGAARAWFDHEAYEYFDEDPDSLDLHSWKPPRHARIARGREAGDASAARRLLAAWVPFLPQGFPAESGMASAFTG